MICELQERTENAQYHVQSHTTSYIYINVILINLYINSHVNSIEKVILIAANTIAVMIEMDELLTFEFFVGKNAGVTVSAPSMEKAKRELKKILKNPELAEFQFAVNSQGKDVEAVA